FGFAQSAFGSASLSQRLVRLRSVSVWFGFAQSAFGSASLSQRVIVEKEKLLMLPNLQMMGEVRPISLILSKSHTVVKRRPIIQTLHYSLTRGLSVA
ncbi:MAG: hypothetical protein HPY80_07020, partial [Bacteroidales bacterium]|nr:hypothetical protein [Bacteroidales bacterium]